MEVLLLKNISFKHTAFDNNPVFLADTDGADTVDPIKGRTTVISSSVDKNNAISIIQTTTNTTTTTNDDGSVAVSYSSASITNNVDAEGNVTNLCYTMIRHYQ